jgi:hypothetical protein
MMTIDEHTIPIESIVLPAPRQGSKWIFTPSEGWSDVLYKDDSGRMWTIDFSTNGRARVSATGIRIPGSEDIDPLDYARDRVVIAFDDDVYVFDVPSGRLLLKISIDDLFGACLTPDGKCLIWFDQADTRIYDLEAERVTETRTNIFHGNVAALPGFGYEAQSATRVTTPGDGDGFHLVVGHYGFALEYSIDYTPGSPPSVAILGAPRVHTKFIFDPVLMTPGNLYPFIAVNDGYGSRIKLIDVRNGTSRSCPDIVASTPHGGYARYFSELPRAVDDNVLIKTVDGWINWVLATDNAFVVCPLAIEPIHFGNGFLWAVKADDPNGLFRYAVDW